MRMKNLVRLFSFCRERQSENHKNTAKEISPFCVNELKFFIHFSQSFTLIAFLLPITAVESETPNEKTYKKRLFRRVLHSMDTSKGHNIPFDTKSFYHKSLPQKSN